MNFFKRNFHFTHTWITDVDNPGKRRCWCGEEEWLFSKPYPEVGEPKYFWINVNDIGKT